MSDGIRKLFDNMQYPDEANFKLMKDWFEARNFLVKTEGNAEATVVDLNGEELAKTRTGDAATIKEVISQCKNGVEWSELWEPAHVAAMNEFARKIEENSDVICEMEASIRGVVFSDSRRAVALLADYLRYYSSSVELFSPRMTMKDDKILDDKMTISLPDDCSLAILAFSLPSALARGFTIVINAGIRNVSVVRLLADLSVDSGFPDGHIKLTVIPIVDYLECDRIDMLFLTGNLRDRIYEKVTPNLSVSAFPNGKTTMIVCDDADLDSAVEVAAASTWSNAPWRSGTILVQEDVYDEFVSKFRSRTSRLRVGSTSDVFVVESYRKAVEDAERMGIEVLRVGAENGPIAFLGGRVYPNNVIVEDKDGRYGTVAPFRTPKEAAALANNTRDGYFASLWSQNSSRINEIARLLDFGTVWVNSLGVFRPEVPFTTWKADGVGYIGGREGIYEHDKLRRSVNLEPEDYNPNGMKKVVEIKKTVESLKRLPLQKRIEKLTRCLRELESSDWLNGIKTAINRFSSVDACVRVENFNVAVYREPRGVVILGRDESTPKILATALLLGNVVLIVGSRGEDEKFLKNFPDGIVRAIEGHEINLICDNLKQNSVVVNLSFSLFDGVNKRLCYPNVYDIYGDEVVKIIQACTIPKNVWFDVGDSY